jgi:iron complex outermembrane receptor protein
LTPRFAVTFPLLLIAVILSWPVGAAAQTTEEIIVTARKREENLQEIPLSISVLSGQQMQERGIRNNYDVALFTPNFNTSQGLGRNIDRPVIRGMSSPGIGGEPNASYFIDGVFVSSSISTATTDAVDRVEVLRGPQSAQFGRATFSGAVNYITLKPGADWSGEINAQAGSDEDYRLSGIVSGPLLADRLGILVSAGYKQYGGQWHNNLAPDAANTSPAPPFFQSAWENPPQGGDGSSLGGEETTDLLLKLNWTPTDSTEINFKYAYTEGDDDHFPALIPADISSQVNCYLPEDPNNPVPDSLKPPFSNQYIDATAPNWETSPGDFCGTFSVEGLENRLNLPDFKNGVTVVDDYALAPVGGTGLTVEERTALPAKPGTRRTTDRFLLDGTQSLGDWIVTGRAAYNEDSFEQVFDLDRQDTRALVGLFHFSTPIDEEGYSLELRVSSPLEQRVRGSLGAYLFHFEGKDTGRSFTGANVLTGTSDNFGNPIIAMPTGARNQTETDNLAVFGSLDIDLTDQWNLALEARWAEDEKTIVGGNLETDTENTTAFTPRITLRYQPTDSMMLYALAASGNKPADFNNRYYDTTTLIAATEAAREEGLNVIEEEDQWTYEFGIKSDWLEGRLTANLSAFYIDWTNQAIFILQDIQTVNPTVVATTTVLQNAGKTKVVGFEFESNFVVNENLNVIANYGYNDGEFQSGYDASLDAATGNGDLNGKEIPLSPNHSGALGLVATSQISSDLAGVFRVDFIYESERWVQAANFNKLDDRKLVNLRLGVESKAWSLTGYVNNLLENDTPWAAPVFVDFTSTLQNGNAPTFYSMNPNRSRHYGLELQYRFGG